MREAPSSTPQASLREIVREVGTIVVKLRSSIHSALFVDCLDDDAGLRRAIEQHLETARAVETTALAKLAATSELGAETAARAAGEHCIELDGICQEVARAMLFGDGRAMRAALSALAIRDERADREADREADEDARRDDERRAREEDEAQPAKQQSLEAAAPAMVVAIEDQAALIRRLSAEVRELRAALVAHTTAVPPAPVAAPQAQPPCRIWLERAIAELNGELRAELTACTTLARTGGPDAASAASELSARARSLVCVMQRVAAAGGKRFAWNHVVSVELLKKPDRSQSGALLLASLFAFCEIFSRQRPPMIPADVAGDGLWLSTRLAESLAGVLRPVLVPTTGDPPALLALQLVAIRVALRLNLLTLVTQWAETVDERARASPGDAPLVAAWTAVRAAGGRRALAPREGASRPS